MSILPTTLEAAAQHWVGKAAGALTAVERNVLQHLLHHDEPERQAAKALAQADSDDQVNLKAEMEIMALHDKLDAIDLALNRSAPSPPSTRA